MPQFHTPQQAGKRLFVNIVDELASSNPTQPLGIIPNGSDIKDGFRHLTAKELADAVNATAWWIEKEIGKGTGEETVAYMGNNDIRYLLFILACHKTSHKLLLPSTRLSNDAYEHILNVTGCKTFFFSTKFERRVSEIKELRPDTLYKEVPGVGDIVKAMGVQPHPFSKSFEEAEDQAALIIHSSGTTGMPKPIPLTHGYLATIDFNKHVADRAGRPSTTPNCFTSSQPILATTPAFHLMGLLPYMHAIYFQIPFVNLPDKPLSVELMIDAIRATRPAGALLPPSLLDDMSQSQEALECLGTLDSVYFAGAPLSRETGDKISKHTQLISVIGSTEMGLILSLVPEKQEDWDHFEWCPEYGVDMQHVGEGLYELVIPRRENSRSIHGIFHTFPDKQEYRTNDLFVQHPSNPNLWKYHGRRDDVIVLSNGEKLNPVTLEMIVGSHPRIGRALLIGQSRFETSLIIEPKWEEEGQIDKKEFIDDVWPTVQQANETVPNYGRIAKNKIRLASRDKPFKVTPKGTTQRNAVNRDYKDEIEAIYTAAEAEGQEKLPESLDEGSMVSFVRHIVCSLLSREDIAPEDDLYGAGLDSLQTIQLAKILAKATSFQLPDADRQPITAQHIYAHSTVSQLAQFLRTVLRGDIVSVASRTERVNNMVAKYTRELPALAQENIDLPEKSTVILTGSTGSLGTYLLHSLLQDESVAKVYCFNRSDAHSRQTKSFQEKGLPAARLHDISKVEFLTVAFGEPKFGLSSDKYQELLDTVDVIIHNAWKVNFNHPLESFENPHIKGLYEFVKFSIDSKYRAHVSFVSSVSTIGGWTEQMGPEVPELPIEDPAAALEQGYGESKHVSERICLEASRRSSVPTSIFRVGQIAGPTTKEGAWNVDEWVPTLVKTSKSLGKVPDSLGGYEVDWVPVDTLATIIVELLHTRRKQLVDTLTAFFNLVNPSKAPWASMIPAIQDKYPVEAVPMNQWIEELENIKSPSDDDVREKPALKLLDFYNGLAGGKEMLSAEISVSRTKEASKTMAALGPISRDEMMNWLNQWDF
ncbi:NRPS-like enzyme [Aspergillus steynii IBT 23096]|uniref:NRPS-like enzyme n=1 Tax=Aspergillus steynii IBT 23096 TaxID=1392250 RepID=A0A2I2GMP5_9EURO|nr:NRPS-like enzyme [Aspergillus steynii IBT 23096]PLB54119.1 NRPS-like enzyme [Aspergillus steynii IBT 23096]